MDLFAILTRTPGRERCGYSVVGTASKEVDGDNKLILTDRESRDSPDPVNLPMNVLFPKGRRLARTVSSRKPSWPSFNTAMLLKQAFGDQISDSDLLKRALQRVFLMPAVGSKSFLITIGDRTVGGLSVRDQMVGPWQTPVSACIFLFVLSVMLLKFLPDKIQQWVVSFQRYGHCHGTDLHRCTT